MDWNWLCARFPVHEALVWGDVADVDPPPSDPQIVTRRFEGKGYWAIVAARPACQDSIWPRGTEVSKEHASYTLTVPGLAAQVEDAVLCDVETLSWAPLSIERTGEDLLLRLRTNWGLVILRKPGGPSVVAFEPLPRLKRGESTVLHVAALTKQESDTATLRRTISAPELVVEPPEVTVPGEVTIKVPVAALPGNYAVSVSNTNGLGIRRFLVVE
jgi:phage baseplate assembly protein gpV